MLRTLLPSLYATWTSCGALFIDCCGALIRLKHTGLCSYLGVITGLGEGSRAPPHPPVTSIKVKNYVESGGGGGGGSAEPGEI